jgi:hypothetical protein
MWRVGQPTLAQSYRTLSTVQDIGWYISYPRERAYPQRFLGNAILVFGRELPDDLHVPFAKGGVFSVIFAQPFKDRTVLPTI